MLINTLDEVVRLLDQGRVVGIPTESSFAFAARLDRAEAIRELATLKPGRRTPIGIIAADMAQLKPILGEIPNRAKTLMRKYWPGPLTIVFDAAPSVPDVVTAGTASVAARIPDDSLLQSLLALAGSPLTATSANKPGQPPIEQIQQLNLTFPELAVWNAVKSTPGGPPSTVVDPRFDPPRILRAGAIDLSPPKRKR